MEMTGPDPVKTGPKSFVVPGLDPGTFSPGKENMEKGGFVYILTNRPHGTLYVGIKANLPQRIE